MYKKYSKPLIVVIIGIIFFVLTVLFRNFLNISAFTDVRPGAFWFQFVVYYSDFTVQ